MDQLMALLTGTTSIDAATRHAAEAGLKQMEISPGYSPSLAAITVDPAFPIEFRQLAAVVLKRFVKEHWYDEGMVGVFVPAPADKQRVRELLPNALGDPSTKIRTAVGMAIARIAQFDWPEAWPTLFDQLLALVKSTDPTVVHGAVRCLSLFTGEISDDQLPHVIPVLFPELLRIVCDKSTHEHVRTRAVMVFNDICNLIWNTEHTMAERLLGPYFEPWLQVFATAVSETNSTELGLQKEVLNAVTTLVRNFPKLMKKSLPSLLQPIAASYIRLVPQYISQIVQEVGDGHCGYDSDCNELGMGVYVSKIFEFLQAVAESTRLRKLLKAHLEELVKVAIAYMQVTEEQLDTWASDPNQYVADEDDETFSYNVRISGAYLLEELCDGYGSPAIVAVVSAATASIVEADALRDQKVGHWWKLREAAIYAVGTVSESLMEAGQIGGFEVKGKMFSMESFIRQILVPDLRPEAMAMLRGRALWCSSKFADAVPANSAPPFLHAALIGLQPTQDIPVRICACKAVASFAPHVPVEALNDMLPPIVRDLVSLLPSASEETLVLILDTLVVTLKADTSGRMAEEVVPSMIGTWQQHPSDPLIQADIMEVLAAMASTSAGYVAVVKHVYPIAVQVLQSSPQQLSEDGSPMDHPLLPSSIEALALIVSNSTTPLSPELFPQSFHLLVERALVTQDNQVLQNITECLRDFVRVGHTQLQQSEEHMTMLMRVVERLLSDTVDENGAVFSGSLVEKIILKLGHALSAVLPSMLTAVVQRLASADQLSLIQSLVMVFARLTHSQYEDMVQFLSSMTVNGKPGINVVMEMWTKHQESFFGHYFIKVSTTALATLLPHAMTDPRLSSIVVEGDLKSSGGKGPSTRSKTGRRGEKREQVSLASRIFTILADTLQREISDREVERGYHDFGDDDEGEGDGGEWEDEDDGESPFAPAAHYIDMNEELLAFGGDDDEGGQDLDSDAQQDPLNAVNLEEALRGLMANFAGTNRALFDQFRSKLSQTSLAALQGV